MTDLESEIDMLRKLDTLRIESGKLRDEGIGILTTIVKNGYECDEDDLSELARVSMALWELTSDPPRELKEWMTKLENLELEVIVNKSRLPILLAAEIMQALAAAPSFAFPKSSLYSYYLIIRELYTADAPNWAIGGARANSKDGMVSAYVTRECVRAIRSLVRVLDSTSNFIAKVGAIQKRFDLLQTSFPFPELKEWVRMEEARLKFDLHTTIRIFSPHLVFQPSQLPDEPCKINIEERIGEIASQLGKTAKKIQVNFTKCTESN